MPPENDAGDAYRPPWFELWRTEVYEYRHTELQKSLALVMATMNHLDSVVKRMESVTKTAEGVAATAEKIRKNWWVRGGVIAALCTPMAAVILEKLWR